ncbi:hypothetical protein P9112_006881 [Eukaryota sp. TZLM1-RC]
MSRVANCLPKPWRFAKWGLIILLILGIVHLSMVEYIYKQNSDKVFWAVFSAVAGWVACFLIVAQVGLGTRNKLMDSIIGLDKMWFLHRWIPVVIILLVISHGYTRSVGRGVEDVGEMIEGVFVITPADPGHPRYQNQLNKINGQMSMYSMIILSTVAYLRRLPGRGRCGKAKGLIPWFIWRPLHFGFYYSLISMFHHVRSSATEIIPTAADRSPLPFNDRLTWAGDRLTVYYALIFFTFYFGSKRFLDFFTKMKQGKYYVVNSVEVISERVTRVRLSPSDGNIGNAKFEAGSFVILNRPSNNLFTQTPHPLSVASKPNSDVIELVIGAGANIAREAKEWKKGMLIKLDGHFGHFSRNLRLYNDVALLAGGVGMAPILSILRFIEEIAKTNKEQGTEIPIPNVGLVLGVRCPEELKPVTEITESLLTLSEEGYLKFTPKLLIDAVDNDEKIPERLRSLYRTGFIVRADIEATAPANSGAFICGPAPFVSIVKKHLKSLNVKSSNINVYNENFLM